MGIYGVNKGRSTETGSAVSQKKYTNPLRSPRPTHRKAQRAICVLYANGNLRFGCKFPGICSFAKAAQRQNQLAV